MMKIPLPVDKLQELQDVAGFSGEVREALEPCLDALLAKKDEFADCLVETFLRIPATRVFLEHEEVPGRLKKLWAHWYETILSGKSVQELLAYLWHIGLKHVEVNLEQSYTNAGFAVARTFMHNALAQEFPPETAFRAARAVDRLLDLCLLVETLAYIENLSSCDLDIMGGIADKVRNPVTIIGGNIRRLMRKPLGGTELTEAYEDIIEENGRLEYMVENIKKYIELFRREPAFKRVSLTEALKGALERFRTQSSGAGPPKVEARLDTDASFVTGSPAEIEDMFFFLLLSCLEDPGYTREVIRVTSQPEGRPVRSVRISVYCPGSTLRPDDSEKVSHPFYSQGSLGTGFGLPTVLLAVRKNHGRFLIEEVAGGVDFVVTLPSAD